MKCSETTETVSNKTLVKLRNMKCCFCAGLPSRHSNPLGGAPPLEIKINSIYEGGDWSLFFNLDTGPSEWTGTVPRRGVSA